MLHTDVYKEKQVSIDGSINGWLLRVRQQARPTGEDYLRMILKWVNHRM